MEVVITADDVPGKATYGLISADQPVFAREVVRYAGEPVAAVAADHPETCRRALAAIVVDYEVMDPLVDPEVAIAGSPPIHPDGNILRHQRIVRGDQTLQGAVIVEGTYGDRDRAGVEPQQRRRLLAAEIEQDIDTSACGGTHRLIGVAAAVTRHRKAGGSLEASDGVRRCLVAPTQADSVAQSGIRRPHGRAQVRILVRVEQRQQGVSRLSDLDDPEAVPVGELEAAVALSQLGEETSDAELALGDRVTLFGAEQVFDHLHHRRRDGRDAEQPARRLRRHDHRVGTDLGPVADDHRTEHPCPGSDDHDISR